MFCYLDFRCYFEANGQNHIHFRLIQVLKNRMAWHFLTFTSPSSKLLFVYPLCSGVEEQMLIFSPIPKLTIVLIWKTPACLKFGKTSNRAVENLPQRKLWVWAANDALSHSPNFPVFLFELFVAQCIVVKSVVKCNALLVKSDESWLCCCSLPTVAPKQLTSVYIDINCCVVEVALNVVPACHDSLLEDSCLLCLIV